MARKTNAGDVEIIKKRGRSSVPKGPCMNPERLSCDLHNGQKVNLLIGEETEIGFKAVINESEEGILYKNEIFQPLEKGQRIEGFIKKIRDDKKIDLCLYKPGYKKVDLLIERVVERLKANNGFLPVTNESPPQVISGLFGVSKKTYKMIIGRLYKKRLIEFEEGGIRLTKMK